MSRSMSFKIAADNDPTHAPVLEFDRIMVFGNLAGKTDCVISSHGTDDLTQQSKANGNFDVPAGLRVHFYCYNGFTYVPDDITTQFKKVGARGALATQYLPADQRGANAGKLVYDAHEPCPNYWLSKSQGRHVADAESASALKGTSETYEKLQQSCKTTGRVVVTVRNRWNSKGVTLQDLITLLQGNAKTRGLTTIHCAFCRGGGSANYL